MLLCVGVSAINSGAVACICALQLNGQGEAVKPNVQNTILNLLNNSYTVIYLINEQKSRK